MGMAELQRVLFRDRNLGAYLVLDDLAAACRDAGAALAPSQREGCRVLAAWNRTSDLDAPGAPLFREFWRTTKDIRNVWRVPFNPADPVTTPAGLNMADAQVREAVFGALGAAVDLLAKNGFAADATLATAQVKQTNRGPVPVHGGDEFEGVLNKVETQGQPAIGPKGYDVNYGSSYIQTVSWDERGPVAQAILTYGQSSDPASPFAFDQLQLFSRKQWNPLPFHAADVAAQQVGPTLTLRR
jgi:acyl-homoserine-lactone acylase